MSSAPFPPFSSPLGHLRPEGMSFSHFSCLFFLIFLFFFTRLTLSSLFHINAAIVRPRLDKFYLDHTDKVCAFPKRSFHGLVTFGRLAA